MEETTVVGTPVPEEPNPGLILTPEAQYYLNEGAGWAKFLGIVGFVMSGFVLLIAIFAGSIFGRLAALSPNPQPVPAVGGVFIGIVYGLMALLYFFPALYIYQFGTNAKSGLASRDTDHITTSISKLKSCLKFWGILTIIMLAFMLIGILAMVAGIGAMSQMHH